ncbi:TlyA family RNA methyltransferase [bacterium]|jgi:23S rRNA (cytidine1920-2'-O)/16S rRNA (cytidine1409-2'-O)-methyltransferase|nr:TlyA family RNA methyltransferase [bacterium]
MPNKKRADLLLVEKGLAPTRQRAQSMILAGQVLANDQPVTKAGALLEEEVLLRIRGTDHPYVSRGGVKLAAALDTFEIIPTGKIALDIGASTGGFTDVLLTRGAERVFALDVGFNQLAWKIRNDPRVTVIEKINARNLEFSVVGQQVDLIVVDVSFISLGKILPALCQFSKPETEWITLIKPQFEVGREKVGKGGIVRSEKDRQDAVEKLKSFAETVGLSCTGLIDSPIEGTDGNKEFLARWKYQNSARPGA